MQSSRWRLQWFLIGVGWNSWFGLVSYWILMKRCRVLLYIFIVLEFPKAWKDTGPCEDWRSHLNDCAVFPFYSKVVVALFESKPRKVIGSSWSYLRLPSPQSTLYKLFQLVLLEFRKPPKDIWGPEVLFTPSCLSSNRHPVNEWSSRCDRWPQIAFQPFCIQKDKKKHWQICKYENNDRYVFKYRGQIALNIFLLDLRALYSAASRIVKSCNSVFIIRIEHLVFFFHGDWW